MYLVNCRRNCRISYRNSRNSIYLFIYLSCAMVVNTVTLNNDAVAQDPAGMNLTCKGDVRTKKNGITRKLPGSYIIKVSLNLTGKKACQKITKISANGLRKPSRTFCSKMKIEEGFFTILSRRTEIKDRNQRNYMEIVHSDNIIDRYSGMMTSENHVKIVTDMLFYHETSYIYYFSFKCKKVSEYTPVKRF